MQNNDNQKTYFIYVRSTGEKVPVTKEQHDSFYKEADRIRHKEQDHGRCMCPYRFIWKCDGDCIGCEYHAAGDISSLLPRLYGFRRTARKPRSAKDPLRELHHITG